MLQYNSSDEIVYQVGVPKDFSNEDLNLFVELLKLQGKVSTPTLIKVNRCKYLGLCINKGEIVSIGAIKPKTNSNFNGEKANLDELRNKFDLELGYCFTLPLHTGNGYSSQLVNLLLEKVSNENVMSSTELRQDNGMLRILQKNGFKLTGQSWKSGVHGGELGLYLKYAK